MEDFCTPGGLIKKCPEGSLGSYYHIGIVWPLVSICVIHVYGCDRREVPGIQLVLGLVKVAPDFTDF